ncbi:splicing regulatory glutamine/lysine-rich protein 1-like isoform X1 [Gigantopelta aegis]|uniref:splicing regulatory glutamine/lysine-rich protein 1-like isoform X1 n=1 Tax=Gigantopelta aegis TaxID=1735272 RepID=UPI001B887547|nr:splicing regulatory glutamine/lysine-rich protein 1-like isoform X1 [Gigantopelta aegis]
MTSSRKSTRLICKEIQLQAPESPLQLLPPPPICRMTNAERVKAWREKMKNQNPEKYQDYLDKNRKKCKKFQETRSEEQKAKEKIISRERVQKYRKEEKQKENTKKVTTRQDIAADNRQREKWRIQKKKQREEMTPQQKRRKKEARREFYKQKKESEWMKISVSIPSETDNGQMDAELIESRTPVAQRKALQRARCALSKSPRKFVSTVTALVSQSSPRKQQLFKKLNLLQGEKQHKEQHMGRLFLKAVHRLRCKNLFGNRLTRRLLLSVCKVGGSYRMRSSLLGINRKTLQRHEKPKHKPMGIKKEAEKKAAEFLQQEATQLPDQKRVSKKTGKSTLLLTQPLRDLHKRFEETGLRVSFSTFAKCRPSNVKLMAQARVRQCLCEYCTNVGLKLLTLNKVVAAQKVLRNLWMVLVAMENSTLPIQSCERE